MATNKLFDTRKKRILWLFSLIVLNAGYKRFIEHTSGPETGSHALSGILSPSLITLVDVFFAITGIVAFIWLIVEVFKGVVSRLRKPKHKES